MPTFTSNYNLKLPLVNDPIDEDLWGDELNEDLDDLDTLMRQGITVSTEAEQTALFNADASISVKKLYPCDVSGGDFTVTIPLAATAENGATVFIKKIDSSANAVTLAASGSDTIDGETTLEIGQENDVYGIVSDGVDKWNSIIRPLANTGATTDPVVGTFSNLKVLVTTNNQTSITVDGIVLGDGTKVHRAVSVSLTNDISTSGANGLDTGSEAAATWYSVWVIYNPTTDTVASLASLSATSPTLPAGYTFKARVGWIRNDGIADLFRTSQKNYRAQYVLGTNPVGKMNVISGSQGSPTIPTWVSASLVTFVPSTASIVHCALANFTANTRVIAAPSNSYNANGLVSAVTTTVDVNIAFDFVLESTNIFYASNSSNSSLFLFGWEDNL